MNVRIVIISKLILIIVFFFHVNYIFSQILFKSDQIKEFRKKIEPILLCDSFICNYNYDSISYKLYNYNYDLANKSLIKQSNIIKIHYIDTCGGKGEFIGHIKGNYIYLNGPFWIRYKNGKYPYAPPYDSITGTFYNDSLNGFVKSGYLCSYCDPIFYTEYYNSKKTNGIKIQFYGDRYYDIDLHKKDNYLEVYNEVTKNMTCLYTNINEKHMRYEVFFYDNGAILKEGYIKRKFYIASLTKEYPIVYKDKQLTKKVDLTTLLNKKSLLIYIHIYNNFIPKTNKYFYLKYGKEKFYNKNGNLILIIKYKKNGNVKRIKKYDKSLNILNLD